MKLQKGHWVSTKNLTREQYDQFCMKLMKAGCERGEYCEFTSYEEEACDPCITCVGWNRDSVDIYHSISGTCFEEDMKLTIEEALSSGIESPKVLPLKTMESLHEDFKSYLTTNHPELLEAPLGSREYHLVYMAFYNGYIKCLKDLQPVSEECCDA